jgi:hypothetical protein
MSDNLLFQKADGTILMEQLSNGEIEIKDANFKKQVEEKLNVEETKKESNCEDSANG